MHAASQTEIGGRTTPGMRRHVKVTATLVVAVATYLVGFALMVPDDRGASSMHAALGGTSTQWACVTSALARHRGFVTGATYGFWLEPMTAQQRAESSFGDFYVRTALGRTPVEVAEHHLIRQGGTEPRTLPVSCSSGLPPRPPSRLAPVAPRR